jgi:hypothetical protein
VARAKETVEQAADELYGLPLDEFTSARDRQVKALRKDDREAADAVKALRKPTVAAWAVNQLARKRRKELGRLLAAGERLRAAQEELLGGGDRAPFQEAAGEERELVAELTDAATDLAGGQGSGLQEKIGATLHAAALDEQIAEQVGAGRLVREQEAIGGFGMAVGGPSRPAPRQPSRKEPAKKQKPKVDERLAAARTGERQTRRELDAAEKALRSAEERAAAAEKHAAEAVERAKVMTERLKEARRAESAARKAHARAERALKSAES